MRLRFPPLAGGVIQGLNDAGIETFEGDYPHYVVRECAQNSLDAAASPNKPVRMEINVHSLPVEELPFFDDVRTTLRACKTFWQGQPKPVEFFDRAIAMTRHKTIYALRISDYGTTGVPGSDKDMDEPWFGLVRSRGVSIKTDEASGGAFGIGKDAPLAASAFRTVVYSTRTTGGDVAVQGICRLSSHETGTELTQGSGFIGNYDDRRREHLALRDENEIPERFLRTETGLDVWIVGFRYDNDWEIPFVAAALQNFWPAIHLGKLELRIKDLSITADRLPKLMEEYRRHPALVNTLPYYQALVHADTRRSEVSLATAGHCRLFVHLGKGDLPRRVCMTRKTGMVIYHYAPRVVRVPFAGLFQCDDQKGNQLLKALEPPRHDNWEPKRATNKQERSAIDEIKTWIRDSLKALVPDLDSKIINEDAIADLLPDEESSEDKPEDGEPDVGGTPSGAKDVGRSNRILPTTRIAGTGRSARGSGGKGGGGTETTDPKKGDGKRSGGRKSRRGGQDDDGGGASRSNIRIDLRSYEDEPGSGVYHLFARASDEYSGQIFVDAVTEDGSGVPCLLKKAYDAKGKPIEISGNKISDLKFTEGESVRLKVELSSPARLALRAGTT